jgi:hypothetical protein
LVFSLFLEMLKQKQKQNDFAKRCTKGSYISSPQDWGPLEQRKNEGFHRI